MSIDTKAKPVKKDALPGTGNGWWEKKAIGEEGQPSLILFEGSWGAAPGGGEVGPVGNGQTARSKGNTALKPAEGESP